MEYIKYNPPGAQLSHDALVIKDTICVLLPLGHILELHNLQVYFFMGKGGGLELMWMADNGNRSAVAHFLLVNMLRF
jgi:hypothetical protein